MNISIWSITYQHYDEKINQSLNTCIILVGVGRINSIQGRWSKGGGGGGGIFSKSRGELAKRGELKNSGGFGPWMKLCKVVTSWPARWAVRVICYGGRMMAS